MAEPIPGRVRTTFPEDDLTAHDASAKANTPRGQRGPSLVPDPQYLHRRNRGTEAAFRPSLEDQMTLKVCQLDSVQGHLPFDSLATGFDPEWWCEASALRGREYLMFVWKEVEVARALLDPQSTDVDRYVGMDLPGAVVKIEFFEVREGFRGQQLGRAAVDAIIERYDHHWFTVASADAGGFWTALGWSEARHITRPDTPTHRYLFRAIR